MLGLVGPGPKQAGTGVEDNVEMEEEVHDGERYIVGVGVGVMGMMQVEEEEECMQLVQPA
jgi:hypothetical protein